MLIELDNDRMLVGIGCNVGSAPSVDATGQQGGRPSTCLADFNPDIQAYKQAQNPSAIVFETDMTNYDEPPHHVIAKEIFYSIKDWLSQRDDVINIVRDFETFMDFRPQKLRNSYNINEEVVSIEESAKNEGLNGSIPTHLDVVPLRINIDGTLQVNNISLFDNYHLISTLLYM